MNIMMNESTKVMSLVFLGRGRVPIFKIKILQLWLVYRFLLVFVYSLYINLT